jgi:hypothetical protein
LIFNFFSSVQILFVVYNLLLLVFFLFSVLFLLSTMANVNEQLYNASKYGHFERAETLLRDNPSLDVNWKTQIGLTALHCASGGDYAEIVKLLLAHPAININVQTVSGFTPLLFTCANNQESAVKLLLRNPRVVVSLPNNEGHTPLWWASFHGYLKMIEWLIASGRDLGDLNLKGKHNGGLGYTALEIARKNNHTEIVSLMERFMVNPTLTHHQVCMKLDLPNALAAEIFALIVFTCDGLLQLKLTSVASTTSLPAARFFTIAARLPMELQMTLCNTVVGSTKQNLLGKDSEPAFKSLARTLLFPQDE